MSKADESFEKLGYIKRENSLQIDYISKIELRGETFISEISFKKISKLIKNDHLLMPEEIKAITEKCKELGWIESEV